MQALVGGSADVVTGACAHTALVEASYAALKWIEQAAAEAIAANVPEQYLRGDKDLNIEAFREFDRILFTNRNCRQVGHGIDPRNAAAFRSRVQIGRCRFVQVLG